MAIINKAGVCVALAGVLLLGGSAHAATPEQKCQGGKNEAAGKLAACVSKAEKKLVTGGDLAAFSAAIDKCNIKFGAKWGKLEQAAVNATTTCPSTADQAAVQDDVTSASDCLATEVSGPGQSRCCTNGLPCGGTCCPPAANTVQQGCSGGSCTVTCASGYSNCRIRVTG